MSTGQIIVGDCRTVLASMEAESVDCCVTSPPYWGLRDYGIKEQIGLEASVDLWVEELATVFDGVARVLSPRGTLWLNLGDAYTSGNRDSYGSFSPDSKQATNADIKRTPRARTPNGMKPKDLIGQPWSVAFALRARGWYLRSEIIWHKPNPMPEPVTDRPTKCHEQVFLFSKREKNYFYDADAIAEQSVDPAASAKRYESAFGGEKSRAIVGEAGLDTRTRPVGMREFDGTRNSRSVWTIPTQGYSGAHFATFPRELAARCIKAGCPMGGLVLDPFAGTGTTVAEAVMLGRRGIGIELNPAYAALAETRIHDQCGLLAHGAN